MPEPLDGGVTVVHRPGVAFVDGEERAVLLDLDRLARPPVVLEGSGQLMWGRLATPLTVDALVEDVADHYGETVETVRPAVLAFVADLLERDLLARS
ncbi:Coenzyme PQQ synthesis protein D (PqqD) [Nocardioides terrae]|uniref:Coenzyme PQQ synthesis protein D (PqqD) n=1 Tax=Nocardioides terrae TaxID=574651 RepID=A0A1I1EJ10_9ACTN|nr:PqqD family protein [Nocardioides terrae]SFB87105.1 Coenzyme PQQ synthesis protein D (PqqD) [Nocardioides terrae]